MSGLDAKIFGVKDVVYIIVILSGLFANWYTMDGRVGSLEISDNTQSIEISELKEENKALASLPKDMTQMQIDIEKNGKTITAIYYGLVAKGIIPPPK